MTLTQQNTRDVGDGVGVLLQSLKRSVGDAADGFARTVGDEALLMTLAMRFWLR